MKSPSIQTKFIIVTSSAVIIFMIIMGFMITRRESAIMYSDIERQGKILAETLAIPVMNDLIYEKLGLVEEGGLIDNYVTEIFDTKTILSKCGYYRSVFNNKPLKKYIKNLIDM